MDDLSPTKIDIIDSYICAPDKRDDKQIQRNNISSITIHNVKKLKPGIC